ncbi:MAG: efflux RND transporter periplasmic adaptor subunit [Gemmatimonadota bacterium]|nr:MAG: efflux RND transporter periplasmic adaptor subunit [Gemmatimonadota bacterium]
MTAREAGLRDPKAGGARRLESLVRMLAAVIAAALVFACSEEVRSDAAGETTPPPRVRLDAPRPDPDAADRYATYLYSESDADVYSRVPENDLTGRALPVVAIHVETGDRVAKGQLLATLDDEMAALEVAAVRPRLEEARSKLERARALAQNGIVTPSELEETEYETQRAEATLRQAELYLSRTRVRAPFAGVVARRYIRVGQMVSETEPLFRITATEPLRARLLIPEDRSARFRIGDPVLLRSGDGQTATAYVAIIGPTVDPASGTREVIVELPEANGFHPGASVMAEVVAKPPDPGAEARRREDPVP